VKAVGPHGTRSLLRRRAGDSDEMTAAHPSLPFGTQVRVENLDNGRTVTVRVNDRGPFVGERIIDVSKAAAKELGIIVDGVATVRIEVDATSVLGSPDDAVHVLWRAVGGHSPQFEAISGEA